MHLRLFSVVAGLVLAALTLGWGIAAARRPGLWGWRGARWWVGWTREPVPRAHGIAVALVGAGLVVSGVAAVLTAPAGPIPPLAHELGLTGLGVVLLGGVLLAATHPAPPQGTETGPPTPQPTTSRTAHDRDRDRNDNDARW